MTSVSVVETPGGAEPLAKAQGAVEGFTALLADYQEASLKARTKLEAAHVDVTACETAVAEADALVAASFIELETATAALAQLEGA